jgi:Na+/melibiose symporter-like transporter
LGWIALIVGVFFTAYFIAYEPYRALYPDLFPAEVAGRAQSTQSLWRGAGTGLALVGGGLLLALARPAPFLAAAALLVGTAATFAVALARRSPSDASSEQRGPRAREVAVQVLGPVREHPALRSYLYANALWELSLAALKTFVVLYLTAGIGLSQLGATAAIAAAVPFIVAGALVSGKLADRYGRISVLRIAVPLYGVGLLVPGIVSAPWAVAIVAPAVAFGGGTIMTLPYAVLMPLMPSDEHGALTGFYSVSRGLGVMVGPLLAGLAIQLLEQSFKSTHGYQAVWLVCGAAMLASVWCVHRLCQQGGDRADLRRSAG